MGMLPSVIYAQIAIGYISTPTNIQNMLRDQLPVEWRVFLLGIFSLETWFTLLYLTAIICVIWGGLGYFLSAHKYKRKYYNLNDSIQSLDSKIRELETEVDDLKAKNDSNSINCYEFFSRFVYNNYYGKFGLTANERISLYRLDMDLFSCIGRHSDDDLYRTKPNRFYNRNMGCIEKVWKTGYYQHVIPHDPILDFEAWKKYNIEHFGFDASLLNNINMKSVSLQGFRIKNERLETIAVLIFESTKSDGLKFQKIKRAIDQEVKNLCHLIEALENHMPSLEAAREEGF